MLVLELPAANGSWNTGQYLICEADSVFSNLYLSHCVRGRARTRPSCRAVPAVHIVVWWEGLLWGQTAHSYPCSPTNILAARIQRMPLTLTHLFKDEPAYPLQLVGLDTKRQQDYRTLQKSRAHDLVFMQLSREINFGARGSIARSPMRRT